MEKLKSASDVQMEYEYLFSHTINVKVTFGKFYLRNRATCGLLWRTLHVAAAFLKITIKILVQLSKHNIRNQLLKARIGLVVYGQ